MNLNNYQNIYFLGIGGIGMSALAHFFLTNDKNVGGYDKTESKLINSLQKSGALVGFKDSNEEIPSLFLNPENTLVIFTPAIPAENIQLNYFEKHNFSLIKRAEALGLITKNSFSLAVAGTHGKTTTSAILGHIMTAVNATSFLGGIAENYNSNLILGDSKVTVVEADEFDRSFLQLSPDIACITSMDADHLDIYDGHDSLKSSFLEFSKKVKKSLIVAKGLPLEGITYAVNEEADYEIKNVNIQNGSTVFDIKSPSEIIQNIKFQLPGNHNLMNALAAFAMADIYGIESEKIKQALQTFKGVQRRFSYKIKTENLVLIDDYAHHPTEINAVVQSVRMLYPGEKILCVFQPHLFSRTKDFADDFADSLSNFDELLLLDIYPARELPIEGISSTWLLKKVDLDNKKLVFKENLSENILKTDAKIIVMLGAGDIGLLVNEIKEDLLKADKYV